MRLVATNSAGTAFGQDVTFTTALAPAPGAPTLGKTFNIAPVSGLVLVFINGHLVPLTQLEQIPSGWHRRTATGRSSWSPRRRGGRAHDACRARRRRGEFGGAVFRLSQQTRGAGQGLATVMMVESAFKGAPARRSASRRRRRRPRREGLEQDDPAAARERPRQVQHERALQRGHGARHQLDDGCPLRRDPDSRPHRQVVVTDFIRHKTIMLHAGQSYFAPGPRKRK